MAVARRNEFTDSINGMKLLGEVITWNPGRAVSHKHKDVVNALTNESLDSDVAREILPSQAFNRAQKQLAEARVIDVVKNEGDTTVFQFTKKVLKGDEWVYDKETKLVLNKITGKVTCAKKELEKAAQEQVDLCLENRNSSDITRIVQKLFEKHADLFSIRDQGGAYFVPQAYSAFTAKVASFLVALGGKMNRFPVPAGTQVGNKSVQEAISSGLEAMITEYREAIQSFGTDTRESTLRATADKIKSGKVKIMAYVSYIEDVKDKILEDLENENKELEKAIRKISKDRTDPKKVRESGGHPGITDIILSLLRKADEDNPITKEEILEVLKLKIPGRDEQAMKRTINGQIHYNLEVNKKIVVSSNGNGGFWVDENQPKKKKG